MIVSGRRGPRAPPRAAAGHYVLGAHETNDDVCMYIRERQRGTESALQREFCFYAFVFWSAKSLLLLKWVLVGPTFPEGGHSSQEWGANFFYKRGTGKRGDNFTSAAIFLRLSDFVAWTYRVKCVSAESDPFEIGV